MRKKLCVLGLCLVLSSTCVTGCGGESQPSKKINLETATETDLCPDISSIFSNPDLISNEKIEEGGRRWEYANVSDEEYQLLINAINDAGIWTNFLYSNKEHGWYSWATENYEWYIWISNSYSYANRTVIIISQKEI